MRIRTITPIYSGRPCPTIPLAVNPIPDPLTTANMPQPVPPQQQEPLGLRQQQQQHLVAVMAAEVAVQVAVDATSLTAEYKAM